MRKKNSAKIVFLLVFSIVLGLNSGCGNRVDRLYKRGIKYARQEKFEPAIVELKRLLQIEPENGRAHNALGQIYRSQNRYSLALEELQKALELDDSGPAPAYNLGTLYQEMEDYDLARKYYREALRREPKFAPALYRLGVVYTTLNQPDEAKSCYERFIQADPQEPEFGHNNLGVMLWYQGDKEEAVKEFAKALDSNPDFSPALFNFGVSQLSGEEKNPAAVRALKRYLKLRPRAPERPRLERLLRLRGIKTPGAEGPATKTDYLERGVKCETAGNYEEARKQYENALKLDPGSLQVHYRLGSLYQKHLNNKRKAIEHYEKFLDYDHNLKSPLAAEVIARLGKVRSQLGYRILAKADLPPSPPPPTPSLFTPPPPIALTPAPELPENYYRAGLREEKRGHLGAAIKYYEKAISLDSQYAPAHFHTGLVYFKEGRYQQARDAFSRAQNLDSSLPVRPQLAGTYLKLGEVAYSEGQFQKALDYYQQARRQGKREEAEAGMKRAHQSLFRSFQEKADFTSAAGELKSALNLGPGSASDYLALGDIYALKLERPSAARPYYEEFLRLAPTHPQTQRVKEFLASAVRPATPTVTKEETAPPLSARNHYNRGALYHREGKTAAAEKEYQAAVGLQPDFPEAYYNLGVLYNQAGNFSRALTFYKNAVRFRPDFALAHLALFKLYYYRFKIKPHAREHARRYIRLAPDSEQAEILKKWLGE